MKRYGKSNLPEGRYFDPDPAQRRIAMELYKSVAHLSIISPHGHVDPRLFANESASFGTPADLLIIPDHYVFRMLYSQGIPLENLGIPRRDGGPTEKDHRKVWQILADHFYLFRGTPTGVWLDKMHNPFMTKLRPSSNYPSSGPVPCLSASTSRSSAQQMQPLTRSPTTRRSVSLDGMARSDLPSGQTRSST
jgi:hypothetical protein